MCMQSHLYREIGKLDFSWTQYGIYYFILCLSIEAVINRQLEPAWSNSLYRLWLHVCMIVNLENMYWGNAVHYCIH